MAEIVLLRHSMTKGNMEGRYIGCRTDEPLCEEGIRLLKNHSYPAVCLICASPMKRCVETAQVIWGNSVPSGSMKAGLFDQLIDGHSPRGQIPMILAPELRECDFGDFENKNYQELNGNPAYQKWIDSGGKLPFPDGESVEAFKRRCQTGFAELVQEITEMELQVFSDKKKNAGSALRISVVVHGGTIMAILERFGFPKRDYFEYQVKNGCGYLLTPVEGTDLWNYQCLP